MSLDDKKLIKVFFEELENYGFDLKLGSLPCRGCGEESEQEMEWLSFFIM